MSPGSLRMRMIVASGLVVLAVLLGSAVVAPFAMHAEENPLRVAPVDPVPEPEAETSPAEETVAQDDPAPQKPSFGGDRQRKHFANVPLPPIKPAEFAGASQVVGAAPDETGETGEARDPAALASAPRPYPADAAVPAAPLQRDAQQRARLASLSQDQTPQQSLPLPPSMKDAQPPDADSDGEEEAASGGNYEKQVETVDVACVKPAVLEIVKRAGLFFQAVPIVTSGFRARGRRGSLHRRCMAVDFVVPGISTQTLANYLRSQPDAGGVGTYCNTKSVHVDIGEKRNWGYCGFHRTYFSMR